MGQKMTRESLAMEADGSVTAAESDGDLRSSGGPSPRPDR